MKKIGLFILIGLFLFTLTSYANSGPVDYYGVYEIKINNEKITYKMFCQRGIKLRMEMDSPLGNSITIIRVDKKAVWNLMPDEKMYIDMPLNDEMVQSYQPSEDFVKDKKKIGEEKILGYNCNIYQYSEDKSKITMWLAQDTFIMIKSEINDGNETTIIEAKEIQLKKQPNSLFELPSDFKKFSFDMPGM